jgi:hypothetical protein
LDKVFYKVRLVANYSQKISRQPTDPKKLSDPGYFTGRLGFFRSIIGLLTNNVPSKLFFYCFEWCFKRKKLVPLNLTFSEIFLQLVSLKIWNFKGRP